MTSINRHGLGQLIAGDVILTPVAGPAGPPGPKGDPGPVGPANNFPAMWSGPGSPPEFIPGAKPGDSWLDTVTGDIYELR
ncbi:hypothetical protein GP475_08725 [Corynebacterium poyangense]|uniref:Collagen triple helix repeat-containing protein n=1 Tax=Corynebacterium poyangense TaxID=2684405 RepID=A0A7H0SQ85_9CORY|nr:hypothetical protein [Corynebacterium poyangense]QNQ90710.1 hypothetical protein GP475_08725 [Corynebacterium poyangense]